MTVCVSVMQQLDGSATVLISAAARNIKPELEYMVSGLPMFTPKDRCRDPRGGSHRQADRCSGSPGGGALEGT